MPRIVEVVIQSLAFGDQGVEGGDSVRKSTVEVLHLCGVRVEPESRPDTATAVRRSLGCVRLAAVGAEPVAWAERDVLTIAVRQSGKVPSIEPAPTEAIGLDYLGLVEQRHLHHSIGRVSYRDALKEDNQA